MRFPRALVLLLPLAALTFSGERDASACGGCFVPPEANTQVTGHRMVLSVSPSATTLWDQIVYSGAPESFAWVLPTKGVVDVGVSSDLLFNTLAFLTDPQIVPPYLDCPNSCNYEDGWGSTGSGASGAGGAGGGVSVIAQKVVGPYETVQLAATDPAALQTWLGDHGYNLPADIAPVVDEYVSEGFNFLAMKLVPGQGIDSMKPVRITTPGAAPVLPLRMVAAGTGAVTPITLWVLGEGRYRPSNFGQFAITEGELVWNWDTSESNYAALKKQGYAANGGKNWLIESAEPTSPFSISGLIDPVVSSLPEQSGYGDENGVGAPEEATADLEALYGTINMTSLWVTRMHAELPRAALGADLQVSASLDQAPVGHVYYVSKTTGTVPACPADPCGDGGGFTSGGSFQSGSGGADGSGSSGAGCAVGGTAGWPAGALGVALAMGLLRWRRRR